MHNHAKTFSFAEKECIQPENTDDEQKTKSTQKLILRKQRKTKNITSKKQRNQEKGRKNQSNITDLFVERRTRMKILTNEARD